MSQEWYYAKGDQKQGPITSEKLRALAKAGDLEPIDLVWTTGMTGWKKMSSVKCLIIPSQIAPPPVRASTSLKPSMPVTGDIEDEIAGSPHRHSSLSTSITPHSVTKQDVGFFRYLADYYAATHGLGDRLLALVLGLNAMAVLSLLKPTLGYRGIALAVACVAGLTLVAAFWLFVRRFVKYFLGHERHVPDLAHSWSSVITHGGMTALLPLCLLVAVEYFSPQQGALANFVPRLKDEQRRWLASVGDNSNTEDIKSVDPKDRGTAERDVADVASRMPNRAPSQFIPQSTIPASDRSAQKSSGESPLPETKNLTPVRHGNSSASKLSKDRSNGANASPTSKDSASAARPPFIQSVDRDSPTEAVVAEGVGSTPDEALKDAFRNAVRQVVGAFVDAETLIKDDQVIDDRVLTYSAGFIKTYDEVSGSKQSEGGLQRIKIKASVERRGVLAKLRAANITVKEVDGKGMFAEVVTQLNAEKEAVSLMRTQFEGFPRTVLTASVIGDPELVEKANDKARVRIRVRVQPDLEAYTSFVAHIQPVLEKIAKDKGEFTAVFRSEEYPSDKSFVYFAPKEPGFIQQVMAEWMPKSFSRSRAIPHLNTEYATVALTTQRSKTGELLECRYYLMDKALQPLLADVGSRKGSGKLSLLDANGKVVVVDRFPLSERVPWNTQTYEGTLIAPAGNTQNGVYMFGGEYESTYVNRQNALCFWISPVFVLPRTNDINYKPSLQVTRTVSLSLDELKSVKEAKVEVTLRE
jgi:GYF domain 2